MTGSVPQPHGAHSPGEPASSLLVVDGGGLIVRERDRIWLWTGDRWLELEGEFAGELGAVLDGEAASGRLAALARTGIEGADQIFELVNRPRRQFDLGGMLVDQPAILFLELTDRCVLHCRHCYAEATGEGGVLMPLDLALTLVDQAGQLGFRRIQLTGGEPLLYPDAADLARRAVEAHIERVEVFTSGSTLDRATLAEFPPETEFAISVYSGDPEVHDRTTGVRGSLQATLGAIDLILAQGHRLRVAVVLMAGNAGDWLRTRELLLQRGIEESAIHFSIVTRTGRGADVDPPEERPTTAVEDPADPEPTRDPAIWPGKAAISPTGDVFPCIFARWLRLGNVHERSLAEILTNPDPPPEFGLSVRDRWRYCSERLSCPDCRVMAFGLMGSGR